MKVFKLNPWRVSVTEAADIQRELRSRIQPAPINLDKVSYVAGADVSFSRGSDEIFAAVVILRYPDLTVVEEKTAMTLATFPYIPGFLTFREGPALVEAFKKIETVPDVVIFDGQGIAHPRRFGIASHMGVLLDLPSVGCAKTVLVGKYSDPGEARGSISPLVKDGDEIGVALRTRTRVSPVFVSIGHKIDLAGAIKTVLSCAPRYRLPEPVRMAHNLSNKARTEHSR